MKSLYFLLLLPFAIAAYASVAPFSGTFSNVKNDPPRWFKSTLANKINLVVITNQTGQQFFIQCFKKDKPGFGVITAEFNSQVQL